MKVTAETTNHETLKSVSGRREDPVVVNEDGHWFYDETWSQLYGPYAGEAECRTALADYAATL